VTLSDLTRLASMKSCIVLTTTYISAVWNFMLEEFPDALEEIPYVRDLNVEEIPHVSIIGGVAVLIGNFIQCFWYGKFFPFFVYLRQVRFHES
jgi:hypothetical protein